MKILFVTPSYCPAYGYGGPTVSVSMLAKSLASIGHEVTVYTTTANGKTELDVPTAKPLLLDGVVVYYFKRITGDHTHLSPGLWVTLGRTTKNFDVVHIQSWWSILNFGVAAICAMKRIKYIISPRGMLSQYSLNHQNKRIKALLHNTIGKRLLKSCWLHATSPQEQAECFYLSRGKGFMLPNVVPLPQPIKRKKNAGGAAPLVIGFLSRIDEKKGLDILIRGLADSGVPFRLKIAGTGSDSYLQFLKNEVHVKGIEGSVEWCGWMNGDEKFDFLSSIDLFALTSQNENFANVVIEALSVGTPVLLSDKVGLAPYVKENKLGWICLTSPSSVASTMVAINNNLSELARIQRQSAEFIKQDFNPSRIAENYIAAYINVQNTTA